MIVTDSEAESCARGRSRTEDKGISAHDKESMSVLVRVLSVSRTPDERVWLARQIERTAIEDGWLRKEHKHPRLVNPPRWRGGEM